MTAEELYWLLEEWSGMDACDQGFPFDDTASAAFQGGYAFEYEVRRARCEPVRASVKSPRP
jgi:hypothetical protein